jgi:hypothetical protein
MSDAIVIGESFRRCTTYVIVITAKNGVNRFGAPSGVHGRRLIANKLDLEKASLTGSVTQPWRKPRRTQISLVLAKMPGAALPSPQNRQLALRIEKMQPAGLG